MREEDSEMKSGLDNIPEFKIPGEEEMSEMRENESSLRMDALLDCQCLYKDDKAFLVTALQDYQFILQLGSQQKISKIPAISDEELVEIMKYRNKLVDYADVLIKRIEKTPSCDR